MASCYDIDGPTSQAGEVLRGRIGYEKCRVLLPMKKTLKNGLVAELDAFLPADVRKGMLLMNDVIREGQSWPFIDEFSSIEQYSRYFLSHAAFAIRDASGETDDLIGCFYIKPNFPGRCSVICNGGFISNPNYRRMGVADFMAEAYVQLAPLLGFSGSMFNLVFATNTASINLWKKHGFKELATIPRCARLKGHDDLVDAISFYYPFHNNSDTSNDQNGVK